jgi:hypothetical protein
LRSPRRHGRRLDPGRPGASLERFGRIDALVDSSGGTQIVAVAADGTDSRPIADGVSGFWNP